MQALTSALSGLHTHHTKQRLPDRYNGDVDAHLYLKQFEQVATSAQWAYEEKGRQLAALLTGNALETLRHMPPNLQADYSSLSEALLQRFSRTTDRREYRALLRECVQLSTQNLDQFAVQVEDCVRGAHPGMDEAYAQQLMAETFSEGLNDAVLTAIVNSGKHRTLSAALYAAQQAKPVNTVDRRVRTATMIDVDDMHRESMKAIEERERQRDAKLDMLIKAYNTALVDRQPPPPPAPQPAPTVTYVPVASAPCQQPAHVQVHQASAGPSKGFKMREATPNDSCYYCHNKGHFRIECKNKKRDEKKGIFQKSRPKKPDNAAPDGKQGGGKKGQGGQPENGNGPRSQ